MRQPQSCASTAPARAPPYTGLKPTSLGFGSVGPVAEKAIESGSVDELERVLVEKVRHEVRERFAHMMERRIRLPEQTTCPRESLRASPQNARRRFAHTTFPQSRSSPAPVGRGPQQRLAGPRMPGLGSNVRESAEFARGWNP